MIAEAYIVAANPSSKNNLGTLIRCAAAFAVEEVIVVGAAKWSTHGAHGSNKHVTYRCFSDWASAANFLRTEKGCDLCGIVSPGVPIASPASADTQAIVASDCPREACLEIPESEHVPKSSASSVVASQQKKSHVGNSGRACRTSTAVRHRPFRRNTAFLVGHRNRLTEEALELCDFLVHVETFGAPNSPVELEPPVTTAIALHHFTAWARYKERTFKAEKFQVDEQPVRCQLSAAKGPRKEERLRAREELEAMDPLMATDGDGKRCDAGLGWLDKTEGDLEDGGDY